MFHTFAELSQDIKLIIPNYQSLKPNRSRFFFALCVLITGDVNCILETRHARRPELLSGWLITLTTTIIRATLMLTKRATPGQTYS